MKRIRSLAFPSLFLLCSAAHATTITENFSNNPLQNGWQVFSDTTMFQWNSANSDNAHLNGQGFQILADQGSTSVEKLLPRYTTDWLGCARFGRACRARAITDSGAL